MFDEVLNEIRAAKAKDVFFTPHALRQMNLPERLISSDEVLDVIDSGEIIDYYPDDPRGASALCMERQEKIELFILYVLLKRNTWQ